MSFIVWGYILYSSLLLAVHFCTYLSSDESSILRTCGTVILSQGTEFMTVILSPGTENNMLGTGFTTLLFRHRAQQATCWVQDL